MLTFKEEKKKKLLNCDISIHECFATCLPVTLWSQSKTQTAIFKRKTVIEEVESQKAPRRSVDSKRDRKHWTQKRDHRSGFHRRMLRRKSQKPCRFRESAASYKILTVCSLFHKIFFSKPPESQYDVKTSMSPVFSSVDLHQLSSVELSCSLWHLNS